ncbi:hypothetical protein Q4485_05600 [Granulosicoccaceae sp. 1_MG-2023]|nr:hypothetical protein [Granulosicoccaceae sp. 1_MG-2023]
MKFLLRHWRALFACGLLGSVFLYGVLVGKYQLPPYAVFESLNAGLARFGGGAPSAALPAPQLSAVQQRLAAVSADAPGFRAGLQARLILPPEVVRVSVADGQASASYYGIEIKGRLRQAPDSGDCLLVYHQGHGGNPFDFDYHEALWQQARAQGCDMLSLSMLGLGLNAGAASYPSAGVAGRTQMTLSAAQAARHGNYAFFRDPALPQTDPLALFLSGPFYLIRSLADDYSSVRMVGISGGGFMTTMLAALMPEIDLSVAYAGSLPKAWRVDAKHHGDWEQVYSALWQELDYWELYLLGTLDSAGQSTRTVHLVHNNADPCCFGDPDATVFAGMMDALALPGVTVQVTASERHAIDPAVAAPLLFP